MISIVTTGEMSFPQLEQDTILNASEKSSVVLAYSCRTGRCSTCKCKVISGDTVPLVDEVGLSQKEKDEGWILTCVRSVTSNLDIQIDHLSDVIQLKPALTPYRVDSIDNVSKDVIRVGLRLPSLRIIGPSGVRRSNSVADHATDNFWSSVLER